MSLFGTLPVIYKYTYLNKKHMWPEFVTQNLSCQETSSSRSAPVTLMDKPYTTIVALITY